MGGKVSQSPHSLEVATIRSNLSSSISFQSSFDLSTLQFQLPSPPFQAYSHFAYIQTEPELTALTSSLQSQSCLGLDLENHYKYSYNGFLCLVQITTASFETFVVDCLAIQKKVIADTLGKKVLQNPRITKVFHGSLSGDLGWIQRDLGVQVVNVIDTQDLYRQLDEDGRQKKVKCGTIVGLKNLWEELCGGSGVSKEEKEVFQHADWSERPLSDKMLNYAAHDSHFMIYIASQLRSRFSSEAHFIQTVQKFNEKVMASRFILRVDAFKPDNYRSQILKKLNVKYDPESEEFLITDYICGVLFNLREKLGSEFDMSPEVLMPNPVLFAVAGKRLKESDKIMELAKEMGMDDRQRGQLEKALQSFAQAMTQGMLDFPQQRQSVVDYYSSLHPQKGQRLPKPTKPAKDVYQNCKMYSSEGEFLCNCNRQKIQWYLDRNLGVLTCENPVVLKLNFQHHIKEEYQPTTVYGENYHLIARENLCVVCGVDQEYTRFHVVPSLYRTNFPKHLKAHKSEDIVLLCTKCHKSACNAQHQLKKVLGQKYGIEVTQNNPFQDANKLIIELRKAAGKWLAKDEMKISQQQQENLLESVKFKIEKNRELIMEKFPEEQQLCLFSSQGEQELMESCAKLQDLKLNKKQKQNPNGEQMIEAIGEDNLENFIILWRSHFLTTMKPKHLPLDWQVNKVVEHFFGFNTS